jgi:RimJ/RimL family protein N-acetyltransferase
MKEYRGTGIGTELMRVLLDLGKNVLKSKVAKLNVYEPNKRAKHVYEKIGFKEVGRI